MSTKLRNPFKIRATEKIDSDAGFLKLFSPLVLESLEEANQQSKLWEHVVYVHSSPGAGKSSLIRVFEPSSLKILLNAKSAPDYRELFNSLKKIDAIDDQGIKALGVVLQCTRNYEVLEELNIPDALKIRLFFSLLNSRIILATLRNICILKDKKFPDDLNCIDFTYDNAHNYFRSLVVPCTGKQLYDWASGIERAIYKTIDSFLPIKENEVEGNDELFALEILNPNNLKVDGKEFFEKILFVLDDAHKFTTNQRIILKKYLAEKRSNFTIWISERLEALEPVENLGSFEGRDYNEINLENFWRKHAGKFEKILGNISDKRASISTDDVSSFQNYLLADLNEEEHKETLSLYIHNKLESLEEISKFNTKFSQWIQYLTAYSDSEYQRAIKIAAAEILIYRSLGKQQLSFDFPMTSEELEDKLSSEIISTARLFLSKETNIPYYYGFQTLTKLSSSNIDQFLSFSSVLFEEMISNKISGKNITVNDFEQDKLIREVAKQKWNELDKIIPFSKQVKNFLNALGEFSKNETYKANAPYAPGVNGFGMKTLLAQTLLEKEQYWYNNSVYDPLVDVISTCVAYNLLEIQNVNQGKKGQVWDVYYLNKWLCVIFDLPLSSGGWRSKTPNELIKWTKKN